MLMLLLEILWINIVYLLESSVSSSNRRSVLAFSSTHLTAALNCFSSSADLIILVVSSCSSALEYDIFLFTADMLSCFSSSRAFITSGFLSIRQAEALAEFSDAVGFMVCHALRPLKLAAL